MEMTEKEKNIVISKAYDYITNVLITAGRPVTFNSLYIGYASVFKPENQLTRNGFKVVYESMLDVMGFKLCPNENCIDGAVSKPNVGMVICDICSGKGYEGK